MKIEDKNNKAIVEGLNSKSKYWLAFSINEDHGNIEDIIEEDEINKITIKFFTNKAERKGFVSGAYLNQDFVRFDLAEINSVGIFIYSK